MLYLEAVEFAVCRRQLFQLLQQSGEIPLAVTQVLELPIERLGRSDFEGFVERGAGVDNAQVRVQDEKLLIHGDEKLLIHGIFDIFELIAHVRFPFRDDSRRRQKKADVINYPPGGSITSAYSSTGPS